MPSHSPVFFLLFSLAIVSCFYWYLDCLSSLCHFSLFLSSQPVACSLCLSLFLCLSEMQCHGDDLCSRAVFCGWVWSLFYFLFLHIWINIICLHWWKLWLCVAKRTYLFSLTTFSLCTGAYSFWLMVCFLNEFCFSTCPRTLSVQTFLLSLCLTQHHPLSSRLILHISGHVGQVTGGHVFMPGCQPRLKSDVWIDNGWMDTHTQPDRLTA